MVERVNNLLRSICEGAGRTASPHMASKPVLISESRFQLVLIDVAKAIGCKLDARRTDPLFDAFAQLVSSAPRCERLEVCVDLSGVTFISASGLVWLWVILCGLANAGHDIRVEAPCATATRDWLQNMGFDLLAAEKGFTYNAPACISRNTQEGSENVLLELTPISSTEDIRAAILVLLDKVAHILESHLGYRNRDVANVSTVLSEACQNICDHSGCAGIAAAQTYIRSDGRPFVVIGVGDAGRGIRSSLGCTYPEATRWTHTDSIFRALERGVSGRGEEDRGLGLPRIQQIVTAYQGRLQLRTGNARISFTSHIEGVTSGEFPGTLLCLALSTPDQN